MPGFDLESCREWEGRCLEWNMGKPNDYDMQLSSREMVMPDDYDMQLSSWKMDAIVESFICTAGRPGMGNKEVIVRPSRRPATDNKRDIIELYDVGGKFFTREAIRDVFHKIRNTKQGDSIWVKGVNGAPELFENATGKKVENPEQKADPDHEWVLEAPTILYQSLQNFTVPSMRIPAISDSYATLQISHKMVQQNKITGEIKHEGPPVPSPDSLEKYFQGIRKQWEGTKQLEALKKILEDKDDRIPRRIDKVIGFGFGRMVIPDDDNDDESKDKSAFLHALILSIRDILQPKRDYLCKIDCFSEAGSYTSADEAVLQDSGVTTLTNPEGLLKVDISSVVVSSSPDMPVRQIVADISRPAVLIWQRAWHMGDDGRPVNDADLDSPRLRKMVYEHYTEIKFPAEGDKHFGELAIYIRRPDIRLWRVWE